MGPFQSQPGPLEPPLGQTHARDHGSLPVDGRQPQGCLLQTAVDGGVDRDAQGGQLGVQLVAVGHDGAGGQ